MEGIKHDLEIKQAPQSLELEQQILGSIILDDKLMREMVDNVPPMAFHEETHQKIYTAMLYLHHNNVAVGYETIINRLKTKHPDEPEMMDYVFELRSSLLTDIDFVGKVELLMDIYQKRELYNLALNLATRELDGLASGNIVKMIEKKIENMGISSNIEYENFQDYIEDWLEYQEDERPIKTIKFGFKLLDDIVLMENSNLILIGARPSVGKSAFATNIVKHICKQKRKPLFVSLEMNKREFMNRMVANMARVEARKLKRKEPKSGEEWARIMKAKEEIETFQFKFYDKGGMTIEQLYGLARYLKKRGELDVVVVDYLQLLETNQYRNQKQNQVSYISQKLKQMAMELDIPVIALAQLNRGVITDGGKPREPHLSDLRDSGSLEQDANIVIMLHTDDVDQIFQDKKYIKLFVRKNRDGRLGMVNYTYYGDYVQFVEKKFDTRDPNADENGWVTIEQDEFDDIQDSIQDNEHIDIDEDDLPF